MSSQSSPSEVPHGRVFYQSVVRYSSINGFQVAGGVRLLIDQADDQAYVQIVSLDDEVLVTHYVQPMSFLAPSSAAGVAWSSIPYRPECVVHDDDHADSRGSNIRVSRNAGVHCARVDTIQVVFLTPREAQRFKTILDALRTAFEQNYAFTAPIAPTADIEELTNQLKPLGNFPPRRLSQSESGMAFPPRQFSQSEGSRSQHPFRRVSISEPRHQDQADQLTDQSSTDQSYSDQWVQAGQSAFQQFNNSQTRSQEENHLAWQNKSWNGSNSDDGFFDKKPPTGQNSAFFNNTQGIPNHPRESILRSAQSNQQGIRKNLSFQQSMSAVSQGERLRPLPDTRSSNSSAREDGEATPSNVLLSAQSSRLLASGQTTASSGCTPVRIAQSSRGPSMSARVPSSLRQSPRNSFIATSRGSSAKVGLSALSMAESHQRFYSDVRNNQRKHRQQATSQLNMRKPLSSTDPYALSKNPSQAGEDPYEFGDDEVLFLAEACLIHLEDPTMTWQEMHKGTLKVIKGRGYNNFSLMLEQNGHVCNHQVLTAKSDILPSCLSQFGFTFHSPAACDRRTHRKNTFLLSFRTRGPYDEFLAIAADIMNCLRQDVELLEDEIGYSDCCIDNFCLVPPQRVNWPCSNMPLALAMPCSREDNDANQSNWRMVG